MDSESCFWSCMWATIGEEGILCLEFQKLQICHLDQRVRDRTIMTKNWKDKIIPKTWLSLITNNKMGMTGEQMIIIKTKTAKKKKFFKTKPLLSFLYLVMLYTAYNFNCSSFSRTLFLEESQFTHYTISYQCLLFNSFKQSFCCHTVSRITLSNIRHPITIDFLEDIFIDFYLIASFFSWGKASFLCALRQYTLKHIQLRNTLFDRF